MTSARANRSMAIDVSKLFDKQVFPDRPWNGRGYGRIRLDEGLAKDLSGVLYEEVHRRLGDLHDAKAKGEGEEEARLAVRRAVQLRDRVNNLIEEQGWW